VSRKLSVLECAGCGVTLAEDDPYPFRCPEARPGDDVDHLVRRVLLTGELTWPEGDEPNPFVRYRTLFHSYHLALGRGMSDSRYVELVGGLVGEVAAVEGRGFATTPFGVDSALGEHLGFGSGGAVRVKDETGNVSGSHKARHLFGLLIHLAVAAETGLLDRADEPPDLAVASCGNAALAAAVVARAAGMRLRVFVPTWADPWVVDRLRSLRASVEVCERVPGTAGDPTYLALRLAVQEGALPFTCQGPENGMTIEGGQTIGYEMVSSLRESGTSLDRVFVQVGGGALASAVMAAFAEAKTLGAIDRLPRFQAVQTRGGHPLRRAYDMLAERMLTGLEDELVEAPERPEDERDRADFLRDRAATGPAQGELRYAARHRSQFMWPWEVEPHSLADGILDDETYDWLAVVGGMIATGGYPVVVEEETLERANELGRVTARIEVDHTGSAGLAGLLELLDRGDVGSDEQVAVLFTGARRPDEGPR
jgi:threonine synthase